MHELSLCESIRRILEDEARRHAFERVTRVCLEVGPFSGVEVEALRFGFPVAMRDSVASQARLEIVEPQGRAWCTACGREVVIAERFDPCPHCARPGLDVIGGTELRIRELEVQ